VRRVLVTHVDSEVGRRLAKTLYHDPDVSLVLGVGTGPVPTFLSAYEGKCVYERLDLARARHLTSFFGSERFARARIDSLIHLPFPGDVEPERIPGNVPPLVSETRRLLDECGRHERIRRCVYLSSGFVYRPDPGSGNLVSEEAVLGLEPDTTPEVRSWIDADLLCQKELRNPAVCMTVLRAATIVTDAGEFLMSPPLAGGDPPAGFNPLVSVVSDRDVARAIQLALHGDTGGIYNIASREVFPLRELRPPRNRLGPLPVPALVSGLISLLGQGVGRTPRAQTGFHRYGVVLGTERARDELGFEPLYRIELRQGPADRRAEAVRAHS